MSHGGFSSQEDDDDYDDTESETGWSTNLALEQETYATKTRIRLRGGVDVTRASHDSIDSTADAESFYEEEVTTKTRKLRKYRRWLKITILFICWMIFSLLLMLHDSENDEPRMLSVSVNATEEFQIAHAIASKRLELELLGPFKLHVFDTLKHESEYGELSVVVHLVTNDPNGIRLESKAITPVWRVELHDSKLFDIAPILKRSYLFNFFEKFEPAANKKLVLMFSSNINKSVPLQMDMLATPIPDPLNAIVAVLLIIGMYVLMIFNIVHRTLAALLASTFALSILAAYNQLPVLNTILKWVDVGLLMEIFGISIIVTSFAKTGIVEKLAAKAYEWANGHIWPMLNIMILIVSLATFIFDNITIIMLMSPIMIRLSEVMLLNPVPVLMCLIIMTNIASAWTPIGDPPNQVIRNNAFVIDNEVGFLSFVAHLLPGTLLAMAMAYLHLRLQFYNSSKMRFTERSEVERLQRVIKVWRKTATGMTGYSKDEKTARDTVDMKVRRLRKRVRRLGKMPKPPPDFSDTLEQLKANYPIRNRVLLYQCFVALLFIMVLYFCSVLYAVGVVIHIPPGWIALLGALLLLVIIDCEMEPVLINIEWATLLFLATLFVLLTAMDQMDLTTSVGRWTENIVIATKPESRLTVAVLLVLWISAIGSAFLVNLPVTSKMLGIVITLASNPDLDLPLQPLIWSLSLGVCLGGNGSLIGAVSNILCVGIAEKHGHRFRFMDFFKIGFPIMLGSLIISTIYLLIGHIVFKWH